MKVSLRYYCCAVLLASLATSAAYAENSTSPPAVKMRVGLGMSLAEVMSQNEGPIREQLASQDPEYAVAVASLIQAAQFTYVDPQARFELSYPAVGSPANTTRLMLGRYAVDGQKRGDLNLKHIEFSLSDGESLARRLDEALALRRYLMEKGFVPVSYDRFEITVDDQKITDINSLVGYVDSDIVPPKGGLALFTLHRDEVLISVSMIHQHYTEVRNDYTLHVFMASKMPGIAY